MSFTTNILGNIKWQIFLLEKPKNYSDDSSASFGDAYTRQLQEWCEDNCSGQFIVTEKFGGVTFAKPVDVVSPLGVRFPTSTIKKSGVYLVAFEEEDEAVLFKTTFGGNV